MNLPSIVMPFTESAFSNITYSPACKVESVKTVCTFEIISLPAVKLEPLEIEPDFI